MNRKHEDQRISRPVAMAAAGMLQRAERDFHDAMARHGHDSAEALVARRIWKRLRRQAAGCTHTSDERKG